MKSFFVGAVSTVLGMALAGAALGFSGLVPVAADHYGAMDSRLDSVLGHLSRASIRRHAPRSTNPVGDDPVALAEGLDDYRESCLSCHGAGRIAPGEFAAGLNPPAPSLGSKDVQSLSDGELFWVISHGIRATGMPAFSTTRDEKEIWRIAAFLRHLPRLTDAETGRLRFRGRD